MRAGCSGMLLSSLGLRGWEEDVLTRTGTQRELYREGYVFTPSVVGHSQPQQACNGRAEGAASWSHYSHLLLMLPIGQTKLEIKAWGRPYGLYSLLRQRSWHRRVNDGSGGVNGNMQHTGYLEPCWTCAYFVNSYLTDKLLIFKTWQNHHILL